jgi:two-component system sensor histidine kinase KdpD
LVDLPADELLQRLQDGKVYQPQQAERAGKSFFRKGNLIALREMALRRTADRVDSQMREYRTNSSISQVWQAKDRLLVCVGTDTESERLVRVAARLAQSLKSDWIAVYVETPKLQRLSEKQRNLILKTLRLAEALGAETATLSGTKVAEVVLNYARSRNVSKLVVGKSTRTTLERLLLPGVVDDLTNQATDIDLHVVSRERTLAEKFIGNSESTDNSEEGAEDKNYVGYYVALALCALTAILAAQLLQYFELTNVVMIYLLGVILISSKYGRWPGIFSSLISVASFDFFFVPPRFSFSVSDTQYLITFAVMLVVALVISNLTANLSYQAIVAMNREKRSRALYDLGKSLASALTSAQIIEISIPHLSGIFKAKVSILLPDQQEKIVQSSFSTILSSALNLNSNLAVDLGVAQWVYDHQQQAGFGTDTLPSTQALYIPLQAPMRTRGVLVILPTEQHSKAKQAIFLPEQRQLLDTLSAQIAIAIERVHYVEVARDALVSMESERLRNSVLNAVSHDLNTPLTSIVSAVDLLKQKISTDDKNYEYVVMLYEQSLRMKNLVTNLLDMARLHSGVVKLNMQWQLLEEVIGTSLRTMKLSLANHSVVIDLPKDLPLLEFDAVLIDRVLCNLLDNSVKYSPVGNKIIISAIKHPTEIWISVTDEGIGLPDNLENQIFEKFTRGEKESSMSGVGLGLSICKAIVEAHHGKIWASNRLPHGSIFTFSLPLGTPPTLLLEDE